MRIATQAFFLSFFLSLFIYLWLCWIFVSVWGLSPVVASGGHPSSRCTGLSLSRPLLLQSTGCRHAGSVIVAHRPSCSTACGILPDQGSNPCPLHQQADSQPLSHQGSPPAFFWLPFAWNIFFHPLTFSLYVSLGLKWVSCRQHIYGSCFCIHSASVCLLVGAFNPLTFNVIIDMYVPMTIFLIVFGFVFVGPFLLLCFLPRKFPLAFVVKLVWS